MDPPLWHSKSDLFWQPPRSNDSTTKYHGSTFIVYNNTIQVASTVNGTYTVVKKRDAQAMNSDVTSSSRKRQRTGRGFVNLGARGTAQMRTDMGPSAEDLYLDVRGGAKNLLWDRRDSALDVSRNGYKRVKCHVVGLRSVIHHDTNPPPSTNIKLPGSFNKSQLPFKHFTSRTLRRMADERSTSSTPPARVGRLEYRSAPCLADHLPPKKADDTSTRSHRSLGHAPKSGSKPLIPQQYQITAMAPESQAVEDAKPMRRWSSGMSACRTQLVDADIRTKDTAIDVERNTVRLELEQLSKGINPQSVHNSRLFWPGRQSQKALPVRDFPVAPLQQSPTLYTKLRSKQKPARK